MNKKTTTRIAAGSMAIGMAVGGTVLAPDRDDVIRDTADRIVETAKAKGLQPVPMTPPLKQISMGDCPCGAPRHSQEPSPAECPTHPGLALCPTAGEVNGYEIRNARYLCPEDCEVWLVDEGGALRSAGTWGGAP